MCQSKGVAFCECSSTEGQNVDLSFAELCRMVEQRVQCGSLPMENICPRMVNEGEGGDATVKIENGNVDEETNCVC